MDSSLLSPEVLVGVSTFASGAATGMAGNLMSEWLGAAGRKVRQKFGTPEQKKALQEVMARSLEKALTHLSVCAGGRRYNERQFEQWLRRERVVDEFIVLLTPQDKELLDVNVLFAEFEAAGLQLARTSFDELIKLMVGVFYKVASSDTLLCQTLQTESLRYIAEEMGALAQLARHSAETNQLDLTLNLPNTLPPLPSLVEQALYRITQEALENIARHAEAEHISVQLSQIGNLLTLIIADDGIGFDPDSETSRWGIQGMRERAAMIDSDLHIKSSPADGTTISVEVTYDSTSHL